jgi:siroheme synthase-like protein
VKTYPVFLVGLAERRTVVLGGGDEAERKVGGLLEAGAAVTVVARALTPGLAVLAVDGSVAWVERDYREGDLAGAFLVVSTGTDREQHARAWREARATGALINAVDDVEHCDFIAGSVVRRSDLVVAISTGGAAPALAVRLRESLERALGPEYGEFVDLLSELRAFLAEHVPDFAERRALWYELVDSAALSDLRAGGRARARRRLHARIRAHRSRGVDPAQEATHP